MSSTGTDVESLTSPSGSLLSAISRRWRVVLAVAVACGVVAVVGVCATAVLTTVDSSPDKDKQENTRAVVATNDYFEVRFI